MTESPVIPTGRELVTVVLRRLAEGHSYDAGVNGTCYECPFGSVPLERDGREAPWHTVSNDPTEAYFRCYLPERDAPNPVWGEYAPCDVRDWTAAALAAHLGEQTVGPQERVWPQDGATDVTWGDPDCAEGCQRGHVHHAKPIRSTSAPTA